MVISFVAAASLALLQQGVVEKNLEEVYGERWTPEARVYSSAGPSVVSIDVYAVVSRYRGFRGLVSSRERLGQGTGVVIDPAGLVITNAHVAVPLEARVEPDQVECVVSFATEFGGEELPARVLNIDREWDLALLKIDGQGPFRAIPLGHSDDLIKGEKVIAIGIPYGNSHSITSGILSGIHRDVTVTTPLGAPIALSGLLQTDAAINPGNSGGPLLNIDAELIGINNATMHAADGISFSIPVDRVREILGDRLLDVDHSPRFWAGMKVAGDSQGLFVSGLHPRGPARIAGIEEGDRLLRVDGEDVLTLQDYARLLLPRNPGDEVEISISRAGRVSRVGVELLPPDARDSLGLLGFQATRSSVYTGRGFSRRRLPALEVVRVFEGTGAERLGLRRGDRILGVKLRDASGNEDWHPVRSMSEMAALVRGPDFVLEAENLWILREEESYRGRLVFDDPDVTARYHG